MRLRRRVVKQPCVLWVTRDDSSPHPYLVASARRAGMAVRELHWAMSQDGERSFGRYVELGGRTGQEHPMSVKVVSPRLFSKFARAPEDVLVIYELGLVGLYAGLSKLFRRHKVVSLVEGDYRHLGRTGTAGLKVAVRRFAARFVDVFVANNAPARDYLVRTLNVPEEKIVVGWWLAGLPADLAARPPAATAVPDGSPLFVCAGRLIPQKGVDLLIRALAAYRRQFGPCASGSSATARNGTPWSSSAAGWPSRTWSPFSGRWTTRYSRAPSRPARRSCFRRCRTSSAASPSRR